MIQTPQGLKLTQDNHIIPIKNITGLHNIRDVYYFQLYNMVILFDYDSKYTIQQIQGDKLIENDQAQQIQDKINKFVKIYIKEEIYQSQSQEHIIGKNNKNQAYLFNLNNNQEKYLGQMRQVGDWSDDEYYSNDKYFISKRISTFYLQRALNFKQLQQFKLRIKVEQIQIQNQIIIMKEGYQHKQIHFSIKTSNKFKLFRKFQMKQFCYVQIIQINGRDIIFNQDGYQYFIVDLASLKMKGQIISQDELKLRDQVFIKQHGLFAQLFQNHLYVYDSNYKQPVIINIKKLVGICNNPRWLKYSESQGFIIFHDYKY